MRYDLNLLPIFRVLMEERSVTRAAERMGMTQPALSNALARLRIMMQDQLFIRGRHGIHPTAVAIELAPGIAEALDKIDDAVLGQQNFYPADAERHFKIALTGYVEVALMPAIAARLQQAAPGITLRLVPYGNDLVEAGVVSGTTAVVLGRMVDPPDNLVVQHLMDEGFACIIRKSHPQIGDSLTREQFERAKHVNVMPPGRLRAGLFQALARQELKRDLAISVTNFSVVSEIVAVTDHIATLPSLICRRLANDPRLRVTPTPVDLGTFPVDMAWHVRYRNDPAHRWLRSLIAEVVHGVSRQDR